MRTRTRLRGLRSGARVALHRVPRRIVPDSFPSRTSTLPDKLQWIALCEPEVIRACDAVAWHVIQFLRRAALAEHERTGG